MTLRVLMTADAVGGVWTYALDLCRALGGFGVEVLLATMGPRPAPTRLPGNVTLVESDYRLEWMDSPWEDVARASDWLLSLERVFRPDVVHLNGYVHAALPFAAPKVVVAHSCVSSWFDAVRGAELPPEFAEYRTRVARGLRSADHVVAISNAMLEALSKHYGPLRNTSVIHNGRDARSFHVASKGEYVFAAARVWDEAKNVRALERVAPRLRWPVHIAGDGDVTESPDTRLGQLSPTAVASWLARAPIYAFPAKYEPFGLSVLEAAHSGAALVLGDIPSLREIWRNDALFVPPDDDDALVFTVNRLIADAALRNEFAHRAHAAAAQYSMLTAAEQYLALYHELLEQLRCAS